VVKASYVGTARAVGERGGASGRARGAGTQRCCRRGGGCREGAVRALGVPAWGGGVAAASRATVAKWSAAQLWLTVRVERARVRQQRRRRQRQRPSGAAPGILQQARREARQRQQRGLGRRGALGVAAGLLIEDGNVVGGHCSGLLYDGGAVVAARLLKGVDRAHMFLIQLQRRARVRLVPQCRGAARVAVFLFRRHSNYRKQQQREAQARGAHAATATAPTRCHHSSPVARIMRNVA
jgi:hypothetical protein